MKLSAFLESIQSLRKIRYGNQIRPVRDWFILITVAIVLLVLGASWNVLEFNNVIASKITAPQSSPHKNALNGATMQKVQDIFSVRARDS